MAAQTPSQAGAGPGRKAGAWFRRWRLPRAAWVYGLVAAVLLALSQLLWLWHSWPVRQILDAEPPAEGASV